MKAFLIISFLFSTAVFACPQGVCIGSRVIDQNNYTGKIQEIFSNGVVKFYRDNYGVVDRKVNQLYPLVRCLGGICSGARVIDHNNYTGKIEEIFSNGVVKFYRDEYGVVDRNITNLSRRYRCVHSLCVGDRVIDQNNYTGYVHEIFENGVVKFNRDNYGVVDRKMRDLGIAENCSATRSCQCDN